MANRARTHLTLYLTSGYALLIIYASLYPLAGWRDSGGDPRAFLGAAWPRYWTGFDLATNTIAYLPFGFFCTAALRRLAPLPAWLVASLLGGGLSLALELLQNYLPNRVPSNLDLACNTLGALLGGLLAVLGGSRALDDERLARWRCTRVIGVGAGRGFARTTTGLDWICSQGRASLRQGCRLHCAEKYSAQASHTEPKSHNFFARRQKKLAKPCPFG